VQERIIRRVHIKLHSIEVLEDEKQRGLRRDGVLDVRRTSK